MSPGYRWGMLLLWALAGCGSPSHPAIVLINSLDLSRPEQPVVLNRDELEARLGPVADGLIPVAYGSDGAAVPGQIDDLDLDGRWDAWAIMPSFGSKEALRLIIQFAEADEAPRFRKRTNVAIGARTPDVAVPRTQTGFILQGGIAWENDVMAFRLHPHGHSGKNVFGKSTTEMVLDTIGADQRFDEMTFWGMDVGASPGLDLLALWDGGRLLPVSYRPEAHITLLAEGAARSIFEIRYAPMVGNAVRQLTERITIWAGRPGFESTVTVSGIGDGQGLVTCISSAGSDTLYQWELNGSFRTIATHVSHGESGNALGLAILFPADRSLGVGEMPDQVELAAADGDALSGAYYARLRMLDGVPSTHYLYAAWEGQDYTWADRTRFEDFLREEARKLASPITMR